MSANDLEALLSIPKAFLLVPTSGSKYEHKIHLSQECGELKKGPSQTYLVCGNCVRKLRYELKAQLKCKLH